MTDQVNPPSISDIVNLVRSFCIDDDAPQADFITVIVTLIHEVKENWDHLPNSTRAVIIGSLSVIVKHVYKTGELQAAMDDILQQSSKTMQ